MAKLTINGRQVTVDDSFLKLSPEEQEATVEEIASSFKASDPRKGTWSGSVLPVSRDAEGKVSFDANAGILGTIKRAFMLPGDVATGKIDPQSDEGVARASEFAGMFSPVNPAIRAGGRMVPGASQSTRKAVVDPPSAEALRQAADQGYDAARALGVEYAPSAVQQMAGQVRAGLEEKGIIGELVPKTYSILGKLENPPSGAVSSPFTSVEAARRAAGHAAKDFGNPTEQLAARHLQRGIDGFLEATDPGSVVAGAPFAERLAQTVKDARANHAAAARSGTISKIADDVDLRSAAAHSGLNRDNTTRQKLASLLQSQKRSAGFDDAEIAAIEGAVEGTPTRNTLRYIANLLGGGGGLGSVVSGGTSGAAASMVGGPAMGAAVGAAVPAIGLGMRVAANKLASRELGNIDAMTRMRSPLFLQMERQAPMISDNPAAQEALIRALYASQIQSGEPR